MHRGRIRALGTPADAERRAPAGDGASLEDVFRHYTGEPVSAERGDIRDVRSTRRTADRVS